MWGADEARTAQNVEVLDAALLQEIDADFAGSGIYAEVMLGG